MAGCWWSVGVHRHHESRRKVRKGCRLAYLLLSEPPRASWSPQAECAGSQARSASKLCTGQQLVPQICTLQPCLGLAALGVMVRLLGKVLASLCSVT